MSAQSSPTPNRAGARARPDAEARRLRRAVRGALRRAERKRDRLDRDLAACDEAPRLRQEAELLKAALGDLPRGAEEVRVPDYYAGDPGAERTIRLDPARRPREAMARRFKRAAKLERGRPKIRREIERNAARCRDLRELFDAFEAWAAEAAQDDPPPAHLVDRARTLRVSGFGGVPDPAPRTGAARGERLRDVRTFHSRDQVPLLVGKSGPGNDRLTFRIARGNDWWFHLAPAAGSHVVARTGRDRDLSQETLLDAATLAVHYSKMRDAPRADVTYAQAKHVHRIKGAGPGKVRVDRPRTVHLRFEPERLARVLATAGRAQEA